MSMDPMLVEVMALDQRRKQAEALAEEARLALVREGLKLMRANVSAYRLGQVTDWTQAYWGRLRAEAESRE